MHATIPHLQNLLLLGFLVGLSSANQKDSKNIGWNMEANQIAKIGKHIPAHPSTIALSATLTTDLVATRRLWVPLCSSRQLKKPYIKHAKFAFWMLIDSRRCHHGYIVDPDFPQWSYRSGVNPWFWTRITGSTAPRQPRSQSQPWCVGVVAVVLCATQRGLGPGQAIFKAKASSPAKDSSKIQPGHWGFHVPMFPKKPIPGFEWWQWA